MNATNELLSLKITKNTTCNDTVTITIAITVVPNNQITIEQNLSELFSKQTCYMERATLNSLNSEYFLTISPTKK